MKKLKNLKIFNRKDISKFKFMTFYKEENIFSGDFDIENDTFLIAKDTLSLFVKIKGKIMLASDQKESFGLGV